jgi:methylmalonyl-CoA mutase
VRLRATVGEVSDALEKVFGRHRADTQKVTGVYAAAYDSAEGWETLKTEINAFAEEQGRRPRVMIAKLGQDGHDRGAKVVATAFADLGFDVDMGPLFQTPEECARQAIENDVHAVGVSARWPPATRRWCRPSSRSSRSRAPTTSSCSSAA